MKSFNVSKMTIVAGIMIALLSGCDNNSSSATSLVETGSRTEVPSKEMTSVLGGKVKIAVPDGFKKMTKEEIKVKYPAGNAPAEAWSANDMSVSIAVSLTNTPLKNDGQLEQVAQQMKKMMAAVSPELSSSEVNGHKTWTIKMTTPAADTSVVNIMQLSILDGKMLLVTFNATEAEFKQYEAQGKAALASVQY